MRNTLLGTIARGVHIPSGLPCAIKQSRTDIKDPCLRMERPADESRFLLALGQGTEHAHPHLPRVLQVFTTQYYHVQVLALSRDGDLFDYLERNRALSPQHAVKWFRQLCSAVQRMHTSDICHLDISCENVLIDRDSVVLCDLGMARHTRGGPIVDQSGYHPGKPSFRAPEITRCAQYDGKMADVYSLGVVLFAMLTSYYPYDNADDSDVRFAEIFHKDRLPQLVQSWQLPVSAAALDLLRHMLCPVSRRLTLQQVVAHPWVAQGPI